MDVVERFGLGLSGSMQDPMYFGTGRQTVVVDQEYACEQIVSGDSPAEGGRVHIDGCKGAEPAEQVVDDVASGADIDECEIGTHYVIRFVEVE